MSGTDWKEMYKVFNMGHRWNSMCRKPVQEIIAISKLVRHRCQGDRPGGSCALQRSRVLTSPHGTFTYH
jgi:hypothetical protein